MTQSARTRHPLSGLADRLRRSRTGPGRAKWDANEIGRLPKNRRFAAAYRRYQEVPAFFNRATIEKHMGKAQDPLLPFTLESLSEDAFSIPVINLNVSLANNEESTMNIKRSFQLFGNSAPKLMVAALPVWLGLTPLQALAQDAVSGSSTNGNVNMPPNAWTPLRTVTFVNDTTRYCMAVGSADIRNPGVNGVTTTYLFTLSVDDPSPPLNDGDERTVQFLNQPAGGVIVQDNAVKEVTTTEAFQTGPGAHVIYWLGRPALGNPATLALDRSETVVCTKERLAPIIDEHPEPTPDFD